VAVSATAGMEARAHEGGGAPADRGAPRRRGRARALALAALLVVASARLVTAQCPDGTPPPCGPRAATPGPNSVAVLALRSVTPDTALAYLSEGLASEITTSLSAVARLEVRSPGVVRSVQRSADADPRAVGRRLNVRYVVEGDYQRGGDRIRIAVRLVTVATGTQRWGNAWTRSTTDLLSVQEEIAREVASNIAGQLLPAERAALRSGTSNPGAWDRFLRGDYALRQRDLAEALTRYGDAVALDPSFVRAHARIAYVYGLLLDRDQEMNGLPAESLLARGMRAADQALAMDARSSDAWMARAMLAEARDPLTLAGSREGFARAVALDPRNEEAWHQYGSALAYLGQDSAAFAAWKRALELDPGRPQTLGEVARLHFFHRHVPETVAICRDSVVAAYTSGECPLALLATGDTASALAAVDAMDRTHGHLHPDLRVRIAGGAIDPSGPWARQRLQDPQHSCSQIAHDRGPLWLSLGQPDSAVAVLERCDPRGPKVWFFLRSPVWDPVRATPRFQRLWNQTRPPEAEVR